MRILIVEDDAITAQLYKKLLQMANFEVATAPDTAFAEDILSENTCDLILLDYQLPDQTGAEWLRMLRTHTEFFKLPVILMSNIPRQENLRSDKFVWFMEKPKLPEQIVTAVEQTIAHYYR